MNPAPPAAPAATRSPHPPLAGISPFPELPVTLQPSPALFTYYVLSSLLLGPAFFIALIPLYFRYHTMRYVVEEEGITMRWGILFRREVSLTYARIQDIHLSSNFVERWLGLARIQVQTASGSASAEMTIEGLPQHEAIRDFLYSRMRGARDRVPHAHAHATAAAIGAEAHATGGVSHATLQQLTETLREVAAEVRELRRALPAPRGAEVDHG